MVKFPTPAWSSTNLLNIAKFVESGLVFAHVRAASDGAVLVGSVNHENTHPFQVQHGRCFCFFFLSWPVFLCRAPRGGAGVRLQYCFVFLLLLYLFDVTFAGVLAVLVCGVPRESQLLLRL